MIDKNKRIKKGMLLAFFTSIISGVAIFYAKAALTKIDPLVLATSRNLYVGILFMLFFLFRSRLKEIKRLNKKNILPLILIGLIGGGIPFYLFFSGLQLIGAQTGNFLHKTLFIWVTALGMIFLKEKLKPIYILSYILVLMGIFFFTPVNFTFGKGEMLVLMATILWAGESILAKKILKDVSSEMVGLFRMGVGGLTLLILTTASGKLHLLFSFSINQLTFVFIGGTLLFFYIYFWYKALKYAPVGLVTLLLTFSVVVGNLFGGGLIGIKMSYLEIYSSIFISLGVFLIYFRLLFRSIINQSGQEKDS